MAKESKKTTKARLVKSPESFREKAVRSSEQKPKAKPFNIASKAVKRALKTITKPFRQVSQKVGRTKAGKLLKKPLRLIGKLLLIPYFRSSFAELKEVTWPSWAQSRRLTYAVLAFAVVFGTAIASLDWVLGKIFKQILIK